MVPAQLRAKVMEESHSGPMGAHFSCSTLLLATGGGKECLQILFTMSEIAQGVQQCQEVEE